MKHKNPALVFITIYFLLVSFPALSSCTDPDFLTEAPAGSSHIYIVGTNGCGYTVRFTHQGGADDYLVTIGVGGVGALNITVPADTLIEVGQNVYPFVAVRAYRTPPPYVPPTPIPTLNWWGLHLLYLLIIFSGLGILRRSQE